MNKLEQGSQSPEVVQQKLDVLIVLGHNMGAGWKGEKIRHHPDHLSGHSKLSALAAGILYQRGCMHKILFSTGHTAGIETPSEAEAMAVFFRKRFPEISESAILLEDKSIDTAGNAEESMKIIDNNNFIKIGLMSTGDHVKNAIVLFQRYGLNGDTLVFSSEKVIAENMWLDPTKNPKSSLEFLRAYRNSAQIKGDRKKEIIRSILLHTIDSKGMLLRQVSKRTRK